MHENQEFTPADGKRLKTDIRTYGSSSRRSEKVMPRRSIGSNILPSSSKPGRSREKYVGPTTVILDTGAYTAKIGTSTSETPCIIPNCIMKVKSERKRFFIGNQIDECRDLSGLYYLLPCERGYITKWNVQKPVWDYIFNNICSVEDKPVIITQPQFNFKAIQEITDEIFFEEYEIKSLYRTNATDLAKYEYLHHVVKRNVPCVIVDSGFSFTHIIPYISGKKYYKAARRINVGGKLLTNHLKDIISYRQLHVMDETYVINQVKEDTSYVSLDFKQDMKTASISGEQNTIVKNYVLPDFNNIRRGYVQQPGETTSELTEGCQILRLNNERFSVPELLFHPSDIGMESIGIAEAIVKCIRQCPARNRPQLAKNIVLIGGNANFPGFKERVYADVRSFLPDHWTVNVYKPENPITFAWKGGKSLAEDPKIKSLMVTKEQYEEKGSAYTYEQFSDWEHSQKVENEETPKPSEIESQPNSILQNSNFTRFDLFGKYELETEEINTNEEDSSQSEKAGFKESEDSRSGENSNSTDIKVTDNEGEASNSARDATESHQDDSNTNNGTKSNERNNKNSKSTESTENSNMDSQESGYFETYDFLTVFDNNYI